MIITGNYPFVVNYKIRRNCNYIIKYELPCGLYDNYRCTDNVNNVN